MSIQLLINHGFLARILYPIPCDASVSKQCHAKAGLGPRLSTIAFAVALLAGMSGSAGAQQSRIVLKVLPGAPGRVIVEGSAAPTSVWSFPDSYAGVSNLGSRVESFHSFNNDGTEIANRKIAPGQFRAETAAAKFRYEVNLEPPSWALDAAKVSWLKGDYGVLMLRDLLPSRGGEAQNGATPVNLHLDLPAGWTSQLNQDAETTSEINIADSDLAVIAVGKQLRVSSAEVSGMKLTLVTTGEWSFSDGEALDLTAKILKAHHDVFRAAPRRTAKLILLPLPQPGAPDKWSAETRGPSVTLLVGRQPSKVAALAQLSVPLSHELLHFWVPNALTLESDYDWFFEGFTVYQAARVSVRLDLLTFAELLNAIGRAYDGYSLWIDHDRWSLIEASKRRWTVGAASVYSKSMVVAFLYDLKLRSTSRRKHSLDEVYRNLFRDYSAAESARKGNAAGRGIDGNSAIIKTLEDFSGMQEFGSTFVSNAVTINLAEQLAPFGLRAETVGLRTRISVSDDLSRPQRDLLRDLGYNDEVRSPRPRKPS